LTNPHHSPSHAACRTTPSLWPCSHTSRRPLHFGAPFDAQLEASRRALKADGAAKKRAEAAALATLRRAEEAKVAAIMDRNAKSRDMAEQRKQAREKKHEQQKEAELSARKRRDAAYAEQRASNHAEEKAKKVTRVGRLGA
jgi:hypothetical protein